MLTLAALETTAALFVFASIFAIVNPIGNLVTVVSLTQGYTPAELRRIALRVGLVGTGVLVVFMLAGTAIFRVFGITIPAFRIAGGIVIFKVAFDLLQGRRSEVRWGKHEDRSAEERDSIAVSPLGVPLYAGPGAITTVMVLQSQAAGPLDHGVIVASILLTFAASYLLIMHAQGVFDRLGSSGLVVFSRIMGLILAAVAVQFVVQGLAEALPGLAMPGPVPG